MAHTQESNCHWTKPMVGCVEHGPALSSALTSLLTRHAAPSGAHKHLDSLCISCMCAVGVQHVSSRCHDYTMLAFAALTARNLHRSTNGTQ